MPLLCSFDRPLAPNAITIRMDYKAKYIINDDKVGLFADVVSITVLRAQEVYSINSSPGDL